jgi:hypothetical protein
VGAAVLAGAAALATGVAAHPSTSSTLRWSGPDGQSWGAKIPDVPLRTAYSVGEAALCVDGTNPVVVRKAEVDGEATGLEVTSFAVRPNPGPAQPLYGGDLQPLRNGGFTPGPGTVSQRCVGADSGSFSELGLEFERIGPATRSGHSRSVLVTYLDGGRPRTAVVPFELTLCSAQDTQVHHCGRR